MSHMFDPIIFYYIHHSKKNHIVLSSANTIPSKSAVVISSVAFCKQDSFQCWLAIQINNHREMCGHRAWQPQDVPNRTDPYISDIWHFLTSCQCRELQTNTDICTTPCSTNIALPKRCLQRQQLTPCTAKSVTDFSGKQDYSSTLCRAMTRILAQFMCLSDLQSPTFQVRTKQAKLI